MVLKPEVMWNNTQKLEGMKSGSIEFKEVEMMYSKKLRPALRDLTFMIKSGEKVAVVGRTGSGKSSMFQLL